MSKKNAIIITLVATVLAVVGLVSWYLFLSPQNTADDQNGISKIISTFFPSSEPTTEDKTIDNRQQMEEKEENLNENQPAPIIREITSRPVAGFAIIEDKKEGPSVLYMESETGNVYSAPLAVISKTRLTNTTIPKVREAVFLPSGEMVITRYLDDDDTTIKSFAGKINLSKINTSTTAEGELQGEFLRDDIVDITTTSAEIFYTVTESGGSAGILANADGTKPAKIFSSQIREWLPQWVGEKSLYMNTKASSKAPGYLFSVNTSNGAQTKVLGGIFGLTTNINPKNTDLVYSDSVFRLFSYNLKTKKVSEMPLQTLAEKCVWDNTPDVVIYCGVPNKPESADYPDDWYKGLIGFKDDLWRMNLTTGEVELMAQFDEVTKKSIDIINPRVSKDGNYVVFTNKNDLSLWSVRVR